MRDVSSVRTILTDRVLCGDGQTIADLDFIYESILHGKSISSIHLDERFMDLPEVEVYNKNYPEDPITVKEAITGITTDWIMPKEYKDLNIFSYLVDKLKVEVKELNLNDDEITSRYRRIKMELLLWEERELNDMLRTLIFIVNTFEENNVVWGTGRGSSCASYILYLIGLHQVDSVEYDLDIGEFFR